MARLSIGNIRGGSTTQAIGRDGCGTTPSTRPSVRPAALRGFIDEEARHALEASQVLEELTPADACEAVDGSRFTPTLDERMETTVRALRRRTQ